MQALSIDAGVRWPLPRIPSGAAIALATALVLVISGCATQGGSVQPPVLETASIAVAPVGGTIPVFVKVHCEANCGVRNSPLTRADVFAVSESGEEVRTLSPSDASKRADGTEPLLGALYAVDSSAPLPPSDSAAIAWAMGGPTTSGASSLGVFGGIVGFAFGTGYASYLATHPQVLLQEKLNAVALSANNSGTQPAWDYGWVFFPLGKYKEVRSVFKWRPFAFSDEQRTEVVHMPWIVSHPASASPDGTERRPSTSSAQ
jgi:hypothetical protein